ncbi:MAG: FAD-dependent oxidoreductase [Spirochaetales bacterium]|jgi:NADH dehydrogenase|nr:FAD-dependent oxidoreductase [Spirochaetales bacterium]
MEKKRIVILGGGYAGVHAAKCLHKKMKKVKDKVEITLIDKNNYHTLMTELHEVAGARVDEASVKIKYDRIFAGKRVNVVQDEIEAIDFKKQELVSPTATYPYDQIIVSTGSESTDFGVPGIKEHGFMLWSLDNALEIREHVRATIEAASYEKDPVKRKNLMTFVVAGAGFTGVEMLGELIEWLPILCKEYGANPAELDLKLVEGLGKTLNMLPDKPRHKAEKYMEKKGVEIRLNSLIVEATPDGIKLKNGDKIATKTLIWTCGIRGAEFGANLALKDGKVGRKQVDKFMKSPDYDNVYLAGDGVWFIEEGSPLPQIVEAAEQTAAVAADGVAYNICRELGCKVKQPKPFKSSFHGQMVSIGGRYCVSHNVGLSMSGFFAMSVKHVVNIIYHFGVCGVNGCWEYIKDQIFNIKNNRSLIGGLAAFKVEAYWVVFLRMFLGAMWLIEGIKKVSEGWLADTTGGHVYWSADAGSAASEALGNAAETVVDTAQQLAPPLLAEPMALFTWVSETFVSQAPYFFQIMIVLGEIALGLMFIGGFFTFIAGVASIGLSLMLLMGAMASKEILWYIAASVVMLGGAGRAFGLDYWVMPWLKKQWNKTPLAKKTYFYLGEPEFTKKQKAARKEK